MKAKPYLPKLLALLLLLSLCSGPVAAQNGAFGERLRDRLRERTSRTNNEDQSDCTKCRIAGLDVAVWKPQIEGKAPLVIFSHGFGGNSTQSGFIMKAMARAGYLVVAPNHKDCNGSPATKFKPAVGFDKIGSWTDKTYDDRRQDIVNLLAGLHADPQWDNQIDWSKLALSGHSLGGYTALGLAGAWPSWKIDGVKAVVALSPYTNPFTDHGNLGQLGVPVMYQGGTKDFSITPFVKRPGGAYSKTGSPVYFVEFDQFNHFTWSNFNRDQEKQDAIDYYCVAFLDKYVKGKTDDRLDKKLPGVVELESK